MSLTTVQVSKYIQRILTSLISRTLVKEVLLEMLVECLSRMEKEVLIYIWNNEPCIMSEVSQEFDVSKSRACNILKKLRDCDLVISVKDVNKKTVYFRRKL